jgi:hydroxymethylpyrimidine pyrophosphatase-like HAD family hydrolase
MTLGDSGNDMAMTRAAGLGLATANAQKILKDVADGEICSNDEHVMQFILEKYFS